MEAEMFRPVVNAPKGTRVVARTVPRGATYGGMSLEPGRVFPLAGGRNDQRLILAGTVRLHDGGEVQRCKCGAEFNGGIALRGHVSRQHSDTPAPAIRED